MNAIYQCKDVLAPLTGGLQDRKVEKKDLNVYHKLMMMFNYKSI